MITVHDNRRWWENNMSEIQPWQFTPKRLNPQRVQLIKEHPMVHIESMIYPFHILYVELGSCQLLCLSFTMSCTSTTLLQEFLRSFCESDDFLTNRRKSLRLRAKLREDDTKLVISSDQTAGFQRSMQYDAIYFRGSLN